MAEPLIEHNIEHNAVLGHWLAKKHLTLSVAESCTGGYLAHLITLVAGSSAYFMGGAVTYSNAAKTSVLGVSAADLEREGAVSETVAVQMAEGAKRVFKTEFALSTTGVSGPDGGSPENPVGTVWIGIATPKGSRAKRFVFEQPKIRKDMLREGIALHETDRALTIKRAASEALLLLIDEIHSEQKI